MGGVHELVIARHGDELSPRGLCLHPKSLEEVEDLPVVVAAVDGVAGYQHQIAANPGVLVVDGAGLAEHPARHVEVAVKVAHRHHPWGFRTRAPLGERDLHHFGLRRWGTGLRLLLAVATDRKGRDQRERRWKQEGAAHPMIMASETESDFPSWKRRRFQRPKSSGSFSVTRCSATSLPMIGAIMKPCPMKPDAW